jgi:heterokaryon incompatibility protein (HET)
MTPLVRINRICINQDNPIERNHQVKRMKDIYQTARTVVVWLGDKEGKSNEATDLIISIRRQFTSWFFVPGLKDFKRALNSG